MEPSICISGMACRFAGGIYAPEHLWQVIRGEQDTIGDLPTDRGWDSGALKPSASGPSGTNRGYFLNDPYGFDADFFGISPREAKATDPQQRIILELAWETLERAGIAPLSLRDTRSGVFVGCSPFTYPLTMAGGRTPAVASHWGTGAASSLVSGRVSYALGLRGPAISVDTGCSSGLVALHLACQSLRLGECDLALAGGITVMTNPDLLIYFNGQRALAPDGRCKPFAASADGTSFGDGAALLLVERLSDARRLGHPVLAIVKGSALSNDGASDGLTVPSPHAQTQVIRSALRNSGLDPADVDAVEAHGTGTAVGDPIEARALIESYGRDRREDDPLWVGSVKSNIGHTQSAAGTAGVIKMVLAMRHGYLPKTLHVDRPTPRVAWDQSAVTLLTESVPWPDRGHPRRAGISSFGISGTNAHMVLQEPPPRRHAAPGNAPARLTGAARRTPPVTPFLLSAKSAAALREQARRLSAHLSGPGCADPGLAAVGHALAADRTRFGHRAVVLAADRPDLCSRLDALAAGQPGQGVITGRAGQPGKVAFVFPGQGAQWPGMAARLLAESRVFARHLADCDDALAPHVDWSLMRMLKKGPDQAAVSRVDMVQPLLFAIAVSLAALWRSMGVEPQAVAGHSQGEIAAAYTCGALSLETAARVSALRATALAELAGTGAMASVPLGPGDTSRLLAERNAPIEIAAVNGPASTTISGPGDTIDRFLGDLAAAGILAKKLPVDYASHSAQVERVRHAVEESLAGVSAVEGEIPFYSSVTCGPMDTSDLGAAYWWNNLRRPVRFAETVTALGNDGFRTFIEASPHPVLASGLQDTLDDALPATQGCTVIGSLRRDHGGLDQFLAEAAKADVAGVPVDWAGCFGRRGRVHVDLPTYPFQRTQYKLDTAPALAPADGSPVPVPEAGGRDVEETVSPHDGEGLLSHVLAQVASILDYPCPDAVEAVRSFHDLGFSSMSFHELMQRLSMSTGLRLSSRLLKECATPAELAAVLHARVESQREPARNRPQGVLVT